MNIVVIRGEGKNCHIGYSLRTDDLKNVNDEIELFRSMTLEEVHKYLISNKIKYDEVEFV